jgi:hypothetical protein
LVVGLNYFVSGKRMEQFNTGMADLIRYDLFLRTAEKFNHASTAEELLGAVREAALTHIVAVSEEFRQLLERCGFKKIRDVEFFENIKSQENYLVASLHSCPGEFTKDKERVVVSVERNSMIVSIPHDGDCLLHYQYHHGLRCAQDGYGIQLARGERGWLKLINARKGRAKIWFSYREMIMDAIKENSARI